MDNRGFVFSPELSKKLIQLRFQYDWLFRKVKQPYSKFRDLLVTEHGFPEEMSVRNVRKKWDYIYRCYLDVKNGRVKTWKYYKIFNKYSGSKSKALDKYESWNDEWRLKLITCISEAQVMNLKGMDMWRTVERAMRCQPLPDDCCVIELQGLWNHIKNLFHRKYRLALRSKKDATKWPLYDTMLQYYRAYDPQCLEKLKSNSETQFVRQERKIKTVKMRECMREEEEDLKGNAEEFQWTKDITEAFIQVRLQNDWMFKQKKWVWHEMRKIMVEQGFPRALSSREICRKWATIMAEYQKAKATKNTSWLYYNLFEAYLGDSSWSLDPLYGWQETWILNLINTRSKLDLLFSDDLRDPNYGWREVEKELRRAGIPLDHSLLELPLIWSHLLKTFRWKSKFATKGILSEDWPYYEAIKSFKETERKHTQVKKQKVESPIHFDSGPVDDDFEDDMKLFDLKRKMMKPKCEVVEFTHCRACYGEQGCVDIFGPKDDKGLGLSDKLKIIGGFDVTNLDNLPSLICLNCCQELENAYRFRRKCQDANKLLQESLVNAVKLELDENKNCENKDVCNSTDDHDAFFDDHTNYDNDIPDITDFVVIDSNIKTDPEKPKTKRGITKRRKKIKKVKNDYTKMCEICGKHTRNLKHHIDAHAVTKMHQCDLCDKKFKFRSGLMIHKAIHDPTPRKTCDICGKSFHIVAQYKRHYVYHLNERKYECDTCGKRFNTSDILRVHKRKHTDERPFTCNDCGKTFRTSGCVSRHKRIVHKKIKQQIHVNTPVKE